MSGEFDYLLEKPNIPTMDSPSLVPPKDPQPSENNDQLPSSDTPIVDGQDEGAGIIALENLSYGDMYAQLVADKSPKMAPYGRTDPERQKGNQLNIRTSDKKNFRIWLRAQHWFTAEYINRLCRFLDSRTADESVTLYVGCKLEDRQTCIVGAIVSAILRCQGTVRCIVTGYCGVPETMIFSFCKEREVRKYGALSIGGTAIINDMPMYKAFYEAFYDRLCEINLITPEERAELWELNKEMILYSQDYYDRMRIAQ